MNWYSYENTWNTDFIIVCQNHEFKANFTFFEPLYGLVFNLETIGVHYVDYNLMANI